MNGALWLLLTGYIIMFTLTHYNDKKFWSSFYMGFLGAGIGGFVVLILLAFAHANPEKVEEKIWRTEYIYSLKDMGADYSGDFFLGSGSINSTWYYAVYVKTDLGFHKEKYEQEKTYIKEDGFSNPTVEKIIEITHRNWLETWLTGTEIKNGCCYIRYVLHVPENTIIRDFRLE